MSASDAAPGLAELAEAVMREGERRLAGGRTSDVPDAAVQRLLTTGARLYARKSDEEGRAFSPVAESSVLTATDVAVTVTALLRAADLNLFDLAMWAGRARPAEEEQDGDA